MHLIDTHAHLYFDQFAHDLPAFIGRALAAGVSHIFLPNVDLATSSSLFALASQYPQQCFAMAGLHPCSVDVHYEQTLQQISQQLENPPLPLYGIGETGIDYYWDTTYALQQQASLQQHLLWAKQYRLPIVLHTRQSFDDTYRIVAQANSDELTGVFHCFSDGVEQAQMVADLGGFYVGIGGNVTYKKKGMADVVRQLPLEWIVLETDAPYLAPEPYRSARDPLQKRNEPAHIALIAQYIAQLKGVSVATVAEITTRNALTLFERSIGGGKAPSPLH